MNNLDRTLKLVHALTESIEGLTLEEMAAEIAVNRRTVERMRDVILLHFDLDETMDGRTKRFRIKDSPGRAFTRPNTQEVAALQAVVEAGQRDGTPQADSLRSLLCRDPVSTRHQRRDACTTGRLRWISRMGTGETERLGLATLSWGH
jgi:proteasome accessory factor B